ncbi:zinc-dependent peptidase [Nocardia sp. NBC_01499]|uniref:hypothetical protein n=1 Tax=Nocardia sp. NBC_01499 TaxID=2903597 RepID=UPI00386BD7F1
MRGRRGRDRLVEQVRGLISTLRVPDPWDLATFLEQVTALLGKKIRLIPLPVDSVHGLPCGFVLERAADIVIAYDAHSSGYHADHIVLHEIGHLLLDHADSTADGTTRATVEILFPSMDPDSVLRVLQRSDYNDAAERQAELFASLVMSESRTATAGSPLRRLMFLD